MFNEHLLSQTLGTLEWTRHSLQSHQYVVKYTGTKTIGEIPACKSHKRAWLEYAQPKEMGVW